MAATNMFCHISQMVEEALDERTMRSKQLGFISHSANHFNAESSRRSGLKQLEGATAEVIEICEQFLQEAEFHFRQLKQAAKSYAIGYLGGHVTKNRISTEVPPIVEDLEQLADFHGLIVLSLRCCKEKGFARISQTLESILSDDKLQLLHDVIKSLQGQLMQSLRGGSENVAQKQADFRNRDVLQNPAADPNPEKLVLFLLKIVHQEFKHVNCFLQFTRQCLRHCGKDCSQLFIAVRNLETLRSTLCSNQQFAADYDGDERVEPSGIYDNLEHLDPITDRQQQQNQHRLLKSMLLQHDLESKTAALSGISGLTNLTNSTRKCYSGTTTEEALDIESATDRVLHEGMLNYKLFEHRNAMVPVRLILTQKLLLIVRMRNGCKRSTVLRLQNVEAFIKKIDIDRRSMMKINNNNRSVFQVSVRGSNSTLKKAATYEFAARSAAEAELWVSKIQDVCLHLDENKSRSNNSSTGEIPSAGELGHELGHVLKLGKQVLRSSRTCFRIGDDSENDSDGNNGSDVDAPGFQQQLTTDESEDRLPELIKQLTQTDAAISENLAWLLELAATHDQYPSISALESGYRNQASCELQKASSILDVIGSLLNCVQNVRIDHDTSHSASERSIAQQLSSLLLSLYKALSKLGTPSVQLSPAVKIKDSCQDQNNDSSKTAAKMATTMLQMVNWKIESRFREKKQLVATIAKLRHDSGLGSSIDHLDKTHTSIEKSEPVSRIDILVVKSLEYKKKLLKSIQRCQEFVHEVPLLDKSLPNPDALCNTAETLTIQLLIDTVGICLRLNELTTKLIEV